ncbi:MAG: response regulator [Deltaproteobacteria bacterium]|nr:response regulator [Deltaproteobacteria bacterium]
MKNLISNSIQAMPSGGTIDVGMQSVRIASGEPSPLEPGEYVAVTVADSGTGIPPELLPHVLDPFGGSHPGLHGLGLSIAFTIVKRHEGHLEIESKPGRGTRVRFLLPVAGDAPSEDARPPAGQPRVVGGVPSAATTATTRVLLMDDDALVRTATQRTLGRLGYLTDAVADGTEAVTRYQEAIASGRPYALVILDLTVPGGMGGLETLRNLRAIDPDVTAVVASGYGNDGSMARAADLGFRDAIAKPYGLQTLRELLGRILESRAS